MATVAHDDDEMLRRPRDVIGPLILISGILCASLLLVLVLDLA